ncbi:MAG: hypothetical protein WCY97_06560 [Methanothrix sp.]|jgi:hypothetical protein|uniref:Lipoprotein n=1 Tax=Methanothrix harundinacea TaxID=301375 RepID=A0A117LG24_9EURY|nr:MAG: hypothetical protein APR56_05580 [Methanosaeta sp. SDB]KUK45207.1 MAG: Uncharacterized protein XD72_0456 [Methanothrix harundinacea]MDD2637669.1 hypothetical protein [Methanothrix sp.]KUK97512.1 MAG: Uncharacterized protein XE07_0342 [Methanothrix harundinacea]MCP1392199.1 hypothetical protein [Methanothrix harundinacea]
MTKRILLVLALAAAAFAGCIGDRPISSGEVEARMTEAAGDLESYRFEIEMDQMVEFSNFDGDGSLDGEVISLRWSGAINLTDQSSMEVSTSTRATLAGNRTAEDTVEVYFINSTLYQKMGDEWIGLFQPDPAFGIEKVDQLAHLMEMIERSEVVVEGSDNVDGQEFVRLKVNPDNDTAYGIMLGQISSVDPRIPLMIDMNGLFERGRELDWTVWVTEETGLPTESRISAVYVAGPGILRMPPESPENLEIRFDTLEVRRFGGYHEPVVVTLPEEAKAAPVYLPDLPEDENVSSF